MNAFSPPALTKQLKEKAIHLGFDACGIAPAGAMDREYIFMQQWLKEQRHGGMHYLEKNIEKRKHPDHLLEGARSVIVTLSNYYYPVDVPLINNYRISRYALGEDYHRVVKKKLSALVTFLTRLTGGKSRCRLYVDSSSLFEKQWAQRAGIGWIGKNSLLITPTGSFYFIGILLTDCLLEYDDPYPGEQCGSCRRCIENCPTGAIHQPGSLDARLCIAYHTIENQHDLPVSLQPAFGNHIYGCDLCQEVCPWNNQMAVSKEPAFAPHPEILAIKKEEWENLSRETFNHLFSNSAVRRCGYSRLMRNIQFAKSNL